MNPGRLDQAAVERLYRQAKAERWQLPLASFTSALDVSVGRAFAHDAADERQAEAFLSSLHLEDLALARACADGIESAWDHFIREYRPLLYRSADAIDPTGGARELADSLYGELFGLQARDGERRSHFHYFHGRSSLATWLRAVLAQRHVDQLRSTRRFEPLTSDDRPHAAAAMPANPSWLRYVDLMRRVLATAIAALAPRDRLRLNCYYLQDLTLAQIGQALNEHEATVSRHLARTRRSIRRHIETELQQREGLSADEIADCFAAVSEDAGSLDLAEVIGAVRKEIAPDRSQ
jgi:RNA polymerase sigma-70 factor